MKHVGPLLETLTRRLADTPPDFMDEPQLGKKPGVVVPALVNDLLKRHAAHAQINQLQRFASDDAKRDRNRLALVQIACWLLADDWFVQAGCSGDALLSLLDGDIAELAEASPAHRFVQDPDRREELARVLLARLDYRPDGETEAQATDRLSSSESKASPPQLACTNQSSASSQQAICTSARRLRSRLASSLAKRCS